jgi:hypothetical protein
MTKMNIQQLRSEDGLNQLDRQEMSAIVGGWFFDLKTNVTKDDSVRNSFNDSVRVGRDAKQPIVTDPESVRF